MAYDHIPHDLPPRRWIARTFGAMQAVVAASTALAVLTVLGVALAKAVL